MTTKELTELVKISIDALRKNKDINMQLSQAVEKEDYMDYEILYDVKDSPKIEKIKIKLHTPTISNINFDTDSVPLGKLIIKRIYYEVNSIDEKEKNRNS